MKYMIFHIFTCSIFFVTKIHVAISILMVMLFSLFPTVVDDELVVRNAAIKFESEHEECVRVLPYLHNGDVEIHLYVYCDRSGIPSELKRAAQAFFGHKGWKLIWADLYNDAFKLLKVTSLEYSSGEPKSLEASQADQIDEIINKNLHVFSNHRNVTALQPSFKVTNLVQTEEACIAVYVLGKGQIPLGESAIPRAIGSYPVDIVNGFFVRTKDPYPTREAHKQDDVLRFGASFGGNEKESSGTLGAIVKDVNSGTLYALSCDHVMNGAVESKIIHPGLDVHHNYLHYNLNEFKGWIQRIPERPVKLPPISNDILKETAKLKEKFSELKTTKEKYSASKGCSLDHTQKSIKYEEILEEAFEKPPRVIAKYLVGVRGNVGSEKNNGREYFIDAAISELNEDEVKNLKAKKDVEIIGTPHYPSGECTSVTTDFEGLHFFKSGSATGFTQRGVLVDSSYIKGSESESNSIWTNVPCINCNSKKAAESQGQGQSCPCEQCKPNKWLKRCLCIKQKGLDPFSDIGDSGAVVFENRGNAQTGYPGFGIIFGMIQCQYYIFALVSPLEIALEALSRKVTDMRPNSELCQLQLVSTYV